MSERIAKMHEAVRASGPPIIELQRALLFTESFKTTEGQPLVLRWGKAIKHIAENIEVAILPGELIVGRVHNYFGRCVIAFPEVDGSLLPGGMEASEAAKGKPGYIAYPEEAKKAIRDVIAPYWTPRDYVTAFAGVLPDETRNLIFGPDRKNTLMQMGILVATASFRAASYFVVDFDKMLKLGCKGIRADAQARLAKLTNPNDYARKAPFLQAVVLACDAMAIWASRFAKLATDLAGKEKDPQRKRELEEIAEVCQWVPENPARTFREALQAAWFVQIWTKIEQNMGSTQGGRMDQYLYPYYRKDIAEGRTTDATVIELLQCVWIQQEQVMPSLVSKTAAASAEGFAHFELVSIGGLTRDGQDATNELSYLLLESGRPMQSNYPEFGIRTHANTPDKLLRIAVEMVKDGKGTPKFLNDEAIIPFYNDRGVPMREAMDYSASSCCNCRAIHRETGISGGAMINMGAVLELTLRNGKIKVLKDAQFGLQTGDPRTFKSYGEFWEAFRKQIYHIIWHQMIQQRCAGIVEPLHLACPIASMLFAPSVEACMDVHERDAGIPGTIDVSHMEIVGKATVVDSLAAIKHLIFDTKKLTWDQLLDAMEKNWEGAEAVRQLCLNAPKYGNGIEWVDAIGWEMENAFCEYADRNPKPDGQRWALGQVPITVHVVAGKVVSATPNGRRAQDFLSEGASASHGADIKGPTVLFNSVARARAGNWGGLNGAALMNVKFTPATVAGPQGTQSLMQIIRTWCSLKLWHVQFNILNKATLVEAQKNPEKYRNLIVRVAGYSAYFVELSPSLQAEIIARTEEQM